MIKNKKFLITGGNGQLAKEFIRSFDKQGYHYFAPSEDQLDITDFEQVKEVVGKYNPDIILNCAAYNDVDSAEKCPQKAFSVNSEAVKGLAEVCNDFNIFLVHFSSDYVFDGQKSDLYTEEDQPNPLNIYGKSKLKGEGAISARLTNFLIFRVSWAFGNGQQNFLYKVLQWASEKRNLSIVFDEESVPTYTNDVVEVTLLALEKSLKGVYHLTNNGYCSRYEWVKYYFEKIGNSTPIIPINFKEILSDAKRPQFSAMSNSKIAKELETEIPHWMDAVDRFVVDYPQESGHKTERSFDTIHREPGKKVSEDFNKKEKNQELINVAILGCGWFGSGLIEELAHWPTITPKIVFEINIEKAVASLIGSGIPKDNIVTVSTATELSAALKEAGKYIVTDNLDFISDLSNIHAVYDASGNILAGAKAAIMSMENGIHFITVSSELDSTVGPILAKLAEEKGAIYSNSDGDQPGVLSRLIAEVESFGFTLEVVGNCKGFLDVHKTPEDIRPWVGSGQNPKMITAFTDGSKQGMELAVVANAFGLIPDMRGMHGPKTTKATLVEDFMKITSKSGTVDFTLGINEVDQGGGVFVIGKRKGKRIYDDMAYLKKGEGPYYLFFRDHHLCYLEAPRTILDVVVYNKPTIAPKGHYADVFTVAKRDLKAGEAIDGVGGYMVYGLIDCCDIVRDENLLPLGLAEYATLTKDAKQDQPITYSMVDFEEDNKVLKLRKEQDVVFN